MALNSEKLDIGNLALQGARTDTEILVTTKQLSAADSGKTLFLSLAGGFTVTLPAVAPGINYRFVVKTNPTTAYIILGGGTTIVGGVNELETDTTEDGPYTAGAAQINLVANLANAGDWIDVVSDGVKWFVCGQTNLDGAVTFT